MNVQVSALEAQIIGILKDWYPITVEELMDELSKRRDVIERALKSLIVKGIIELEPLSDKTYIRLLVPDIVVNVPIKGRRKKRPERKKRFEDDSIMYG